jgi:uncharacterized protein
MTGETNLRVLLRSMTPELDAIPYGIVTANSGLNLALDQVFATVRESEGLTLIAAKTVLHQAGYGLSLEWARITLQIHSSLEAVGLTAAFATALGHAGISANVIAGYHHDHIFVQWDKRHDAMSALTALSRNS